MKFKNKLCLILSTLLICQSCVSVNAADNTELQNNADSTYSMSDMLKDTSQAVPENIMPYDFEEDIVSANAQVVKQGNADYTGEFIYLSDLSDELVESSVGYSTLKYDENIDGGMISLLIDGSKKQFLKGIGAHAPATLVYDVTTLVNDYNFTKFTSYLGVDAGKEGNGNGVRFNIYTSTDNENWTSVHQTAILKGNTNAEYVEVDLNGVNYLKIVVDANDSNSYDHSILGSAMFCKDSYTPPTYQNYDFFKTVAEYDDILSTYGTDYDSLLNNTEYKKYMYQRTIVNGAGYDMLQMYCNFSEEYRTALEWFFNDYNALDLYITGGAPSGNNYARSCQILMDLYTNYKDDVSNPLYKRMMIAIALSHCVNVSSFTDNTMVSDAVTLYAAFKNLYVNGHLINNVFEDLNVEELRVTLSPCICDEEIEWMNYYTRMSQYGKIDVEGIDANNVKINPYSFIEYTFGYDYTKDIYYSEENKSKWQDKYHLVQKNDGTDDTYNINVTYEAGHPRVWMVYEEGSVCGGIAKTGVGLANSFGVPATGIGQPAHAAYLKYCPQTDENGNILGKWLIWNDVSGWTKSEKGERLPLGWGNQSWKSTFTVSYILLAQACLNDEDNLNKAEDYVRIANISNNADDKIALYEKALEVQSINLDAWEGLAKSYIDAGKSQEEILNLGKRITENLTYYPLPMWDLVNAYITPQLSEAAYIADINVALNNALDNGSKATEENTLQPSECKTMANYLMGNNDTSIAKFSFDGENGGSIVLSDTFASGNNEFLYSLDGGENWTNAGMVNSVKLTDEEIASINADNDIMVKLQGSTNSYTIDIVEGTMPSNIYNNDNENRMIGIPSSAEWSTDNATWNKFSDDTVFNGDKTIYVRNGATGNAKATDSVQYSFTTDTFTDTRSYIPIGRINVTGCSSAQSEAEDANKTNDGNINTIWHTQYNIDDTDKYVTYELDKPTYISGIDYIPRQSASNGIFSSCEVYTSLDGENWTLVGSAQNWANNANKKSIDIEIPAYAKYVKVVAPSTYGSAVNKWASAAMIEFFEDTTKSIDDITAITIKKPVKTDYVLGDELNLDGLKVFATLSDDSTRELSFTEYVINTAGFDSTAVGSKTISINIYGKDIKADFYVNVYDNAPVIITQPKGNVYTSDEEIKPLAVEATVQDAQLKYQWYRASTNTIDKDNDTPIEGAVTNTYTPTESGYYYAMVYSDKSAHIYTDVVNIDIGDYVAMCNNIGYDSLYDAVNAAKAEDTVTILKDITVDTVISINKNITIESKDKNIFNVNRDTDYTGSIFNVTGGSTLTLNNIIFDGGAVWSDGTFNTTVDRYITNTGITATAAVVNINNSNAVMNGCTIQNAHNSAGYATAGGAISASGTSKVTLNDTKLYNNQTNSYGGAVMLKNNSTLTLNNSEIKGSYGTNSGGAICVDHSCVTNLNNSIIENNCTTAYGVIWISNGQLNINEGTVISSNTANSNSVIRITGSGTVNVNDFDTITDAIFLDTNKRINITGDISDKNLPIILNGSWVNDSVFGTTTNKESAKAVKIVGCVVYVNDNNQLCVTTENGLDYNNDGLLDTVDVGGLLRYISGLTIPDDFDTTKAENDDLLSAVSILGKFTTTK